ncbi:Uncharacterised protein [Klebsiella pneumoniae]|nr:Uncharacterised protein [Klebsiella pneumoniae]
MVAQIVGVFRAAMAANIVGGRDDQRRSVTQRPGDVGIRQRLAPTVADGEIEPFAGQRDQSVGHLKLQMQLGMLMQKWRNRRNQLLAGKGHRRGQAQRSPQRPPLIAGAGENIPQLTKRLVEIRHQPQSVVAEAHAAGGAMDEGFAGHPLQFADFLTDSRLADPELFRGPGIAFLLFQHRQPVQMRPVTLRTTLAHVIVHQ